MPLTKKENPYLKYRNPDKRCQYPFEPSPLGYCWGYANLVDKKATKKEIEEYCSKEPCEFWKQK